ncbi:MAG: gamma-glutamyltransferase [Gammaproteobacteria bacterium]|nr:gamma-glutamyltransferase [Gammaproteobacteria bacterium]
MSAQPAIHGHRFMVSAGHDQAALAAYEILEAGGNAVDAGVAAVLTLGVVLSEQVNTAGVAPMIIHLAERDETVTLAGVGHWSRSLDAEAYIRRHGGQIPLGVERSVVPAAPETCVQALERFGTMSFSDVAARAMNLAREGFAVHRTMAQYLSDYRADMANFADNMAIWMPHGRPPLEGERVVLADLARTFAFLCDEERAHAGKGRAAGLAAVRNAFYKGDIARTVLAFYKEHGGWLTEQDLADFRAPLVPPSRWRGRLGGEDLEVLTCGPWCQGPMLPWTLAILEQTGIQGMSPDSVDYLHTVAEALKLAFADREAYLGDPDFVDVPDAVLSSAEYGRAQAARIRPDVAFPGMPAPGRIDGHTPYIGAAASTGEPERVSADTSVVAVVDAAGNAFCSNPSDPSWDVPVVPDTGLIISSRGSQSWAVPGHPSVLAPGKRPRLTPNPSIARVRGKWIMPFGSPGGDAQVPGNLQFLLNVVLHGMGLQDAVEAPRIMTASHPNSFAPHVSDPGRLHVEAPIEDAVMAALEARGHRTQRADVFSFKTAGVCAVRKDLASGSLSGAADPRRPSRAMGW